MSLYEKLSNCHSELADLYERIDGLESHNARLEEKVEYLDARLEEEKHDRHGYCSSQDAARERSLLSSNWVHHHSDRTSPRIQEGVAFLRPPKDPGNQDNPDQNWLRIAGE